MGDSTFRIYLNDMIESRPPLLRMSSGEAFRFPASYPYPEEFRRQDILLAEAGIKLLHNELDWVAINGIDKWLGGVYLTPDHVWRWDCRQRRLAKAGM